MKQKEAEKEAERKRAGEGQKPRESDGERDIEGKPKSIQYSWYNLGTIGSHVFLHRKLNIQYKFRHRRP